MLERVHGTIEKLQFVTFALVLKTDGNAWGIKTLNQRKLCPKEKLRISSLLTLLR